MRVHDFAIETFPGIRLHETMKRFREEGPLARIKFLGMPAWLLVSLGGSALLLSLISPMQYMTDVIAAFLPLNLAAAWVLIRADSGEKAS